MLTSQPVLEREMERRTSSHRRHRRGAPFGILVQVFARLPSSNPSIHVRKHRIACICPELLRLKPGHPAETGSILSFVNEATTRNFFGPKEKLHVKGH